MNITGFDDRGTKEQERAQLPAPEQSPHPAVRPSVEPPLAMGESSERHGII